MRQLTICFSAVVLGVSTLATAVSAQTPAPMKSTAPEKMLPPDQARHMRACAARAMQQKIRMEDHAGFVAQCMAEMARPH